MRVVAGNKLKYPENILASLVIMNPPILPFPECSAENIKEVVSDPEFLDSLSREFLEEYFQRGHRYEDIAKSHGVNIMKVRKIIVDALIKISRPDVIARIKGEEFAITRDSPLEYILYDNITIYRALNNAGYHTIGDIIDDNAKNILKNVRGIGVSYMEKLCNILTSYGFDLTEFNGGE